MKIRRYWIITISLPRLIVVSARKSFFVQNSHDHPNEMTITLSHEYDMQKAVKLALEKAREYKEMIEGYEIWGME